MLSKIFISGDQQFPIAQGNSLGQGKCSCASNFIRHQKIARTHAGEASISVELTKNFAGLTSPLPLHRFFASPPLPGGALLAQIIRVRRLIPRTHSRTYARAKFKSARQRHYGEGARAA